MRNKLILFAIALLLVFGVSASLGTFKQGECISIKVLANCSNINLTEVTNANGTFVLNGAMTNLGGQTFNYTFCNTTYLGKYAYSWNNPCIDCSLYDCGNEFYVTTTGKDYGNIIPLFIFLGGLILFGFAFFGKNEYLGLFSGFLFIVGGIYMMIYGLGLFSDMYTRSMSFIALGIGLVISFISVIEMFYTPLGVTGGEDD